MARDFQKEFEEFGEINADLPTCPFCFKQDTDVFVATNRRESLSTVCPHCDEEYEYTLDISISCTSTKPLPKTGAEGDE